MAAFTAVRCSPARNPRIPTQARATRGQLSPDSGRTRRPHRQQLHGRSRFAVDALVDIGAILQNRRAFRDEVSVRRPKPASFHLVATPSLASTQPKLRLFEQGQVIPCRRLQRQRGHARLLPIRYIHRSHRSASGSRGFPGKPEFPRWSPKRGPRPIFRRPKATGATKPSTIRSGCSSPAARSAGKPANHRRSVRSRSYDRNIAPPLTATREQPSRRKPTKDSRPPPESPEEPSRGFASHAVKALREQERSNRHRSVGLRRQKPQPKLPLRRLRSIDCRNRQPSGIHSTRPAAFIRRCMPA
jgi:hypothetical protein